MESNKKIADNKHRIYERMQKIGTAISFVNANNTHSGNLSMRDPLDPDLFYITAKKTTKSSMESFNLFLRAT